MTFKGRFPGFDFLTIDMLLSKMNKIPTTTRNQMVGRTLNIIPSGAEQRCKILHNHCPLPFVGHSVALVEVVLQAMAGRTDRRDDGRPPDRPTDCPRPIARLQEWNDGHDRIYTGSHSGAPFRSSSGSSGRETSSSQPGITSSCCES